MKHSRFGYSAVSTFEQCPFRYKCQYLDELKTLPNTDPANALIIGTALHTGIETDVETAIQQYFSSYPIITDQHVDEEIKLRNVIPKVKEVIPDGLHEVRVVDKNFIGTLDLLVPTDDGQYDLYDFKYSNNRDRYMESRQLHLYKYYYEKTTGNKIRDMYFVFVPKVQIRQKKTEDLFQFRQRLQAELDAVSVTVEPVEYDPQMVIDHLELTQDINSCTDYPKKPTRLCDWCDYKKFCQEGDMNDMALPSTNRVAVDATKYKKIWIYGAPFSGKTTVCDAAPTPLNINTDGNTKMVTMARQLITQNMEEGRQKLSGWDYFKRMVSDLEDGSDFETIVVDLLEDMYELCRLHMYKQMGITHESDDSFRAWDKVRTEYLSTMRRLLNLPYNVILISHEDLSKDITKRTGDKITAIKPNIQDKIANKIAGMVDIVCRVMVEDDGRYLSFKSDAVTFGGGRITGHGKTTIPLSWDAIEEFYASVGGQKSVVKDEPVVQDEPEQPKEEPAEVAEEPKRRTRRARA